MATAGAALVAGVAVASGAKMLFGAVAALCLVAIVLLHLPLAIALWMPMLFMPAVPGFYTAETTMSVLVLVAFLGAAGRRGARAARSLERRWAWCAVTLFSVWIVGSASWARRPDLVVTDLQLWLPAILLFVIVAAAALRPTELGLVIGGYVVGAIASVAVGLLSQAAGGVLSAAPTGAGTVDLGGRFTGGEYDPNYLAAALVPAIVLAAGLVGAASHRALRAGLWVGVVALTGAVVATESRGGLVAGVAALGASVVLLKGRRVVALLLAGGMFVAGSAWILSRPAVLERLSGSDLSEGAGRIELWQAAQQMVLDHPLLGVGLGNFVAESGRYARDLGGLEYGEFLTDEPKVAHNLYLQVLAETGAVGLLLFLALLVACVTASLRAARRFDLQRASALALLSRALAVAQLAMLVASVFLSNGYDKRLWVLLALGLAAERTSATDRGEKPRAFVVGQGRVADHRSAWPDVGR